MKANWWGRSVPCAVALWGTCVFGQYYVTTVAGGVPTNVAATSVSIGPVSSVAVDSAGNMYFPSGWTVVQVNARTHVLTVVAGSSFPGFGGDGGPATAAQLFQPSAVAVDSAGNLYIADSYRIREVSGGIITTIAGNGTAGTTGDGGPAVSAEINPISLATDSVGNLYIGNRIANVATGPTSPAGTPSTETDSIREISHGVIATIAGNGACCHVMSDGVAATSTPLYELGQIAVDANGNLYAATSAYNNSDGVNTTGAILKISNGIINTFTLGNSTSVAVDSAGNVYYCYDDNPANAVYEVSDGNASLLLVLLGQPQALAVDGGGNLYIADSQNAVIRQFANGSAPPVAGNGHISFSGDGGPATSAQFDFPGGLAFDSAGNLYVVDGDNSRIREIAAGIINTVAGSSLQGFAGDGGPATAAGLYNPSDVAFDSAGNMYIADSVDQCVRMVSKGIITTIAGRGSGANEYGDGGPATAAELFRPATLRVDAAGNLYIVDSNNYRVREVANGIIATIAGNGSHVSGGDGGPAASAGMSPGGIAFDPAGDLFVSDSGRIREISGGIIHTIAGTGTPGDSADNLPALTAAIDPGALLIDAAGDIYFSEADGRVRVLRLQSGACATYLVEKQLVIGDAGGPLNLTILDAGNCPWTVQGLPSWITYSGTGGAGPATIAVTVAANSGVPRSASFDIANSAFTVTQEAQLTVTTASPLPLATTGAAYSQSFAASGGQPPYTWSIASGSLPNGLTLSSAGALSGTPLNAGIYNFTLEVTDSASALTSLTYNLTAIAAGAAPPPGSLLMHALPILPSTGSPPVIDSAGNVYVVNHYVPGSDQVQITPGAAQTQPGGGTCVVGPATNGPCQSAYIGKMDANGNLIFGTLLGGQTFTTATAIAVDSAGNVYIAGTSFPGLSGGPFPTTAGAAIPATTSTTTSLWAAKLNASGSQFDYVTFLPNQFTSVTAIAVDSSGNAYIGGSATAGSTNGFVVALNANGTAIQYTALLAGTPTAMTVNPSGNLVAAGNGSGVAVGLGLQGIYVQTLDSSGSVQLSQFPGGNPSDSVSAIATDSAGEVFIAGATSSLAFPTTNGTVWSNAPIPLWSSGAAFGYVVRAVPGGNYYSTYVMGNGVTAMAVTPDGEAYVTGTTLSGFPVTTSAPQPCLGGNQDAFVAHLSADGATLIDATYVGANTGAAALSLGANGTVYLDTGAALAQVRFGDASYTPAACLTPTLLNAASQTASAVAGEFVTLVGYGIGPQTGAVYQPGAQGQIPTATGGVQVFFDGVAAPVLYAQSLQVNAEAPFTIAGTTVVTLQYGNATFGPFSMPVSFADPEILRQQIGTSTLALAINQDNTLNSPDNPAAPGSVVYFYGTGFGQTNPACSAGGANIPAAAYLAGITVTADNGAAPVQYAGSAPTLPCGVAQINMQVPANAPAGPYAIDLTAHMGGNAAASSVSSTIVVK